MNSRQLAFVYLVSLAALRPSGQSAAQPSFSGKILAPLAYQELAPNAIEPQGWLRPRLVMMRASITGQPDETYPKVRDSNGWQGWRWLDGCSKVRVVAFPVVP